MKMIRKVPLYFSYFVYLCVYAYSISPISLSRLTPFPFWQKYECLDGQKPKMPIDYNFFLEEEDDMNVFKEKKKGYSHSNSRQNVNNILSVRSMQSMENSQSIENVKSVENAQSMQNARIMQNTRSMQMSSGKNREHNYSSNSSVSINPFSRTPLPSLENKMCKKPVNLAALTEPDVKKESTFFNIKSLLGVADKSASSSASPKAKNYSSSNTPPAFPQ